MEGVVLVETLPDTFQMAEAEALGVTLGDVNVKAHGGHAG